MRYSGISVVWQFGSMIASGPFTVVATALLLAGGNSYTWVAMYVGALIVISIAALCVMPETAPSRRSGQEYTSWPDLADVPSGSGDGRADQAAEGVSAGDGRG